MNDIISGSIAEGILVMSSQKIVTNLTEVLIILVILKENPKSSEMDYICLQTD